VVNIEVGPQVQSKGWRLCNKKARVSVLSLLMQVIASGQTVPTVCAEIWLWPFHTTLHAHTGDW
jgi:hypothetical protein